MKKTDVDALVNMIYSTITTIEMAKSRTPAEAAARMALIKSVFALVDKVAWYVTSNATERHNIKNIVIDLRNRLNKAMSR